MSPQPKTFDVTSDDGVRPPLPPRSTDPSPIEATSYNPVSKLRGLQGPSRPQLQASATTALSRPDVHTQSHPDGTRETFVASSNSSPRTKPARDFGSLRRLKGPHGSEGGDTASIRSCAPTLRTEADVESLLGEVLGDPQQSSAWTLNDQEIKDTFELCSDEDDQITKDFYHEFDDISSPELDDSGEGRDEQNPRWIIGTKASS